MRRKRLARPGFTLVELLVVMGIILAVTILAIPVVNQVYGERGIQESARIVHAAFVRARDDAARLGTPCGLRFEEDPTWSGYCSRVVPLATAPDYDQGLASSTDMATLPAGFVVPFPCVMVEQSGPLDPTYWDHNVRVGDKIRVGGSRGWMTVVGPTTPESGEFVAYARLLDRGDGRGPMDYLWLVDGLDDDADGYTDDGWDGFDNDADGVVDEIDEWEPERWTGPPAVAERYAIQRRPVPESVAHQVGRVADEKVSLPAGVAIDLAGLPAEILFGPRGDVTPASKYGVTTATGLAKGQYRFRIVDRGRADIESAIVLDARTGHAETQ